MCVDALGDSLMEVLGNELRSSGRAANISNHRAISSPLQIFNFKKKKPQDNSLQDIKIIFPN